MPFLKCFSFNDFDLAGCSSMFLAFHYGSELVFYLRWLWALGIHPNLFCTGTKRGRTESFYYKCVREGRGFTVKCYVTAAWLAQLVECQSALREVEGSSLRPDQHAGS